MWFTKLAKKLSLEGSSEENGEKTSLWVIVHRGEEEKANWLVSPTNKRALAGDARRISNNN